MSSITSSASCGVTSPSPEESMKGGDDSPAVGDAGRLFEALAFRWLITTKASSADAVSLRDLGHLGHALQCAHLAVRVHDRHQDRLAAERAADVVRVDLPPAGPHVRQAVRVCFGLRSLDHVRINIQGRDGSRHDARGRNCKRPVTTTEIDNVSARLVEP